MSPVDPLLAARDMQNSLALQRSFDATLNSALTYQPPVLAQQAALERDAYFKSNSLTPGFAPPPAPAQAGESPALDYLKSGAVPFVPSIWTSGTAGLSVAPPSLTPAGIGFPPSASVEVLGKRIPDIKVGERAHLGSDSQRQRNMALNMADAAWAGAQSLEMITERLRTANYPWWWAVPQNATPQQLEAVLMRISKDFKRQGLDQFAYNYALAGHELRRIYPAAFPAS